METEKALTRQTSPWASFSSRAAFLILAAAPLPLYAEELTVAEDAMETIFPGAVIERETLLLTPEECELAAMRAGQEKPRSLISRFCARANGEVVGYGYLDKHRVRTLPEILMIAVTTDGVLQRIEVLAFKEPTEYRAREAWLTQFTGRTLEDALRLKKNVDGISGATLTARATTQAARRVLAVHDVLKERQP